MDEQCNARGDAAESNANMQISSVGNSPCGRAADGENVRADGDNPDCVRDSAPCPIIDRNSDNNQNIECNAACAENREHDAQPEGTADSPPPPESARDIAMQTRVKRVGLAALILSFGILCSRLLGYVREAVIAYQAGAGTQTDAYNAAFMLPDLMNHFLAGGTLSITFIPLFAGYIAKGSPQKAQRLFSLIATTMGSLVVVACALCFAFADPLSRLLFPGFGAEQIALTAEMTRIVLPGQFFHYLGGLMMAVLMAQGRFLPSALAPLIYNLSIITFGIALGFFGFGMKGFAVGALAGAFLGPFLLPLCVLRRRITYRPVFGFGDPDFKKYIFLTLPLMLGVSLTTVDEWIGRIIGSTMDAGSISWLNYARRLALVPIAIVGQAAGQAALPYLSQLSAKGALGEAADALHKTLKNVVLLSLVLIGFFAVLAEPMTAIVYERGAFGAEDTAKTASILRILSISIVFWTIQMVSVRAFYAAQNTLRPMVLTTAVTAVSVPIYIVLSRSFGLAGLAASSCIGMAMQACAVMAFYHRYNPRFSPLKVFRAFGVGLILCAAAAAGSALGLFAARSIGLPRSAAAFLLELCLGGGLGLIFAVVSARFAVPEAWHAFCAKVMKKLRRS